MKNDALKPLYASLFERWMPEQIVKTILDGKLLPSLEKPDEEKLRLALPRWMTSSMPTTFDKARDLQKQLQTASELFDIEPPDSHDQDAVWRYILKLKNILRVEGTDFKNDRLDRKERRKANRVAKASHRKTMPWIGHRAYNKRFRLIRRLEKKYLVWQKTAEMRELAQIAKSRLANRISWKAFSADSGAACFIAYMAARLNRRSIFTFGRQDRAFDTIAEILFRQIGKKADWLSVAFIHPATDVLEHLTQRQKGRLLGTWFDVMKRSAAVLEEQAKSETLDLVSMVVKKGNDSSTWNEAAGAFNKARDGWIATLHALGAEEMLEKFAPGKAMRLMAADVAWDHRMYGTDLEPDTAVWDELPKPWDVLSGKAKCSRAEIEAACTKFGIEGKGWIVPRIKTIAAFKPTPELVHGVVVASPELAEILKDFGYFGGPTKRGKVKGYVPISRAMNGLTPIVE